MSQIDLPSLRRGEETTYLALVNAYHPVAYRLATIHLPRRAVTDETVREMWGAVLRGLAGLDDAVSVRIGVGRLLREHLMAKARALRVDRSGGSAGEVPASTVPAEEFVDDGPRAGRWKFERHAWPRLPQAMLVAPELYGVAMDAVAGLPLNQREVITLRDVEGWTAPEVSELLDLSEPEQRSLLHLARSEVRRALEKRLTPDTRRLVQVPVSVDADQAGAGR